MIKLCYNIDNKGIYMKKTKHLVFIGAPGSGKGTQASLLAKNNGYIHLSTGDLLRAESKKNTELGKKIANLIDNGQFLDDATMIDMLNNNIDLSNNTYVFDGFPRNIKQVMICEINILKDVNQYQVIIFDIDFKKLTKRLINRRACGQCNLIFNLLDIEKNKKDECPSCKSKEILIRKDDNKEVIKKRFTLYKDSINEMINFYKAIGARITTIDANQSPETIYNQIINILE